MPLSHHLFFPPSGFPEWEVAILPVVSASAALAQSCKGERREWLEEQGISAWPEPAEQEGVS